MPNNSFQLKLLLTALDTDQQALADAIGEQRPVVNDVLNGKRKAQRTRRKMAEWLCQKVKGLILPEETGSETA